MLVLELCLFVCSMENLEPAYSILFACTCSLDGPFGWVRPLGQNAFWRMLCFECFEFASVSFHNCQPHHYCRKEQKLYPNKTRATGACKNAHLFVLINTRTGEGDCNENVRSVRKDSKEIRVSFALYSIITSLELFCRES